MGILDPLFDFFTNLDERIDNLVEGIINPQVDDEQASDEIGQQLENIQPADEAGAALVDIVEEFIISDLEDQGEINPSDVESALDGVEGRAVGTTIALGLSGTAIEAASLGQVDQQQEYIMQIAAALQLDDVAGGELKARIAEGDRRPDRPSLDAVEGTLDVARVYLTLVFQVGYDELLDDVDEGGPRLVGGLDVL